MKKSISTELNKKNIALVLQLLEETPHKLKTFSAKLSPEESRLPLGIGERSFAEILAHLINCEAVSSEAIYLSLMLDEPLLHPLHPERDWGRLLHYEGFQIADMLAYFQFRRAVLLQLLNSLDESQWARVVREENKQRKESVYWRARGLALHELEHMLELEAKLA